MKLLRNIDDAVSYSMNTTKNYLARSLTYELISKKYTRGDYQNLPSLLARCPSPDLDECIEALTFFSEAYHQSQAVRLSADLQTPGFRIAPVWSFPSNVSSPIEGAPSGRKEVPWLSTTQLLTLPTRTLLDLRKKDQAIAYFAALDETTRNFSSQQVQRLADATWAYLREIAEAYVIHTGIPLPRAIHYLMPNLREFMNLLKPESGSGLLQRLFYGVLDQIGGKAASLLSQGFLSVVLRSDSMRTVIERASGIEHVTLNDLAKGILQDQVTRRLPKEFDLKQLN